MQRRFEPDASLLASFECSDPEFVADTERATVWKVIHRDQHPAALKLYRGGSMGSEAAGFAMLQAWDGQGAARLLNKNSFAALIEWLEGPSLGDFTRDGKDKGAATLLVRVARRLQSTQPSSRAKLPHLGEWFVPLLSLEFADECPPDAKRSLIECQVLTKALLASETDLTPLHGDLHHDNIRLGRGGFCAFDAKGVIGERAYELANAFRNPNGAINTVNDPARAAWLGTFWAREFGVDEGRLLAWAAVKCALSIAWRAEEGRVSEDEEFALLSMLLNLPGRMATS